MQAGYNVQRQTKVVPEFQFIRLAGLLRFLVSRKSLFVFLQTVKPQWKRTLCDYIVTSRIGWKTNRFLFTLSQYRER